MRHYHIIVGVLLCTLFVLVLSGTADAHDIKPHCIVEVDPYDFEHHATAFQACADMTAKDAAGLERHVPVFAHCGDYVFDRQVNMINIPLFMPLEDDCWVKIKAHRDLGNQRIFFFYSATRSEVTRIEVDGNSLERMNDSVYSRLSKFPNACTSDETRPANVEFHGRDLVIHKFVSRNALCGTCLGIREENMWMWDVLVEKCGFSEGVEPNRSHQFGDGLTFVYCNGCIVTRTTAKNTSDLGFAFGGGGNNHFYENWCIQDETFAFGCFNFGRFYTGHKNPATGLPWDGNHKGTLFEKNHVLAKPGKLIFGIAVGKDFFEPNKSAWLAHVGTIRENWSDGAQIPFAIDGIEEGDVEVGYPSGASGVRKGAFNHCGESKNSTAGHMGKKVRLKGAFARITFDGGVCEVY